MALPERPREHLPIGVSIVVGVLAIIGVLAIVRFVLHLLFGVFFGVVSLLVLVAIVGALVSFVLRPR